MSGINGKRIHYVYDHHVYAGLNQCKFIPNNIAESVEHVIKPTPDTTLSIFICSNRKYRRIVLFVNGEGVAGLLVNTSNNEIVYQETHHNYRRQGINRQLKAFYFLQYGRQLWAQHLSDDALACLKAAA